jgi:TPR repeat protein
MQDTPIMSLLPRFALSRQRANEAALQQKVSALQVALNQCKGVATKWRETRYEIIATVAVISLAIGFAAGVYREPLLQPVMALARHVGIAATPPSADAANAAYQKGDYKDALAMVQPLAEAGDVRAQSLLGLMYYRGRAVAQDDKEAATWFRRAADGGDATAQFYLGGMYAEGRGVPQDYAESAQWYHHAADQGDGQAQYNLGLAYARGEGVEQNLVNAHMMFNLSAARLNDPRGRTAAIKNRDQVAGEMTSEQISEAQKLARDWHPK